MPDNINILTPFSRLENKEILIEHLKPFNIHWYPIIHEEIVFNEDWITPIRISNMPANLDYCYFKLNYFLDYCSLEPEDYYGVLCDDDFYENDFFEKLRMNLGSAVLIVSMKRGLYERHELGKIIHPITTLNARPDNMFLERIGLEQMFIKGWLFRKLRFLNFTGADGYMAEFLEKHIKDIRYIPDVNVLFNWLEKGRWAR